MTRPVGLRRAGVQWNLCFNCNIGRSRNGSVCPHETARVDYDRSVMTVRAPVVFADLETTGLSPVVDDVWEYAGIRREVSGTEATLHLFIEHSRAKCERLPEPFATDHRERFPTYAAGCVAEDQRVATRAQAAQWIALQLAYPDRPSNPHLVGAVPSFDDAFLKALLAGFGLTPAWSYHLIDVENLAVGWLANSGGQFTSWHDIAPPYDSEVLSRAVGVNPADFERYTAMGDVLWARAIYDRVVGDAQRARDRSLAAVESPLDAETPRAWS